MSFVRPRICYFGLALGLHSIAIRTIRAVYKPCLAREYTTRIAATQLIPRTIHTNVHIKCFFGVPLADRISRKDSHVATISAIAAATSTTPRFFDHSTSAQQKSEIRSGPNGRAKRLGITVIEQCFASSVRSSSYPSTAFGIAILLRGLSLATNRPACPSCKAQISDNPIRTSGQSVLLRTNSF